MHRDCHPSTPKKSYLRGGRGGKRWKVLFCINELWTENIKKFGSSQNHFVAKRFRVKKPSWNIYKSTPSDTRVLANIGTLFCAEEISSKKWSVLILRYQTKRKFSKTCLFGQGAFSRKTIGRIMKRPSPPSHELLRVAETILFSRRKFDGFKKCYRKLKQRIMGEKKELWIHMFWRSRTSIGAWQSSNMLMQ